MKRILFLAAALMLLSASNASAHPHLWITNTTAVEFKDGKVVAVEMRWVFDAFWRLLIAEEYDFDKDGSLNEREQKVVKVEAFENLKELNYFTSMKVAGKPVTFEGVTSFDAELREKDVVYTFRLELPRPAAAEDVAFSVRDESYYTDIIFDEKDPVKLVGEVPGNCLASLNEDKENPYYFGLIYPIVATVQCSKS